MYFPQFNNLKNIQLPCLNVAKNIWPDTILKNVIKMAATVVYVYDLAIRPTNICSGCKTPWIPYICRDTFLIQIIHKW